VPHHAVYPCASRSAAATLRSPRLPRVRDCGRGVCEAWGVEVTGGGRARGRARLVHRRRARSRRCATRLRWRRDGGARPRHLLGRGEVTRRCPRPRRSAAGRGTRAWRRRSRGGAWRPEGERCGGGTTDGGGVWSVEDRARGRAGGRRTAHLSGRRVTVVLPAEQSHGRTIVGDVALTLFLGVEI
jgi:hypothetical protein